MNIVITISKTIPWEEYEKELKAVEDGTQQMNYRVSAIPKNTKVGERCYLLYDGYIRGWMTITDMGTLKDGFDCTTTQEHWRPGNYICRSGKFHYLKNPVKMRGFRGYRYIDDID